MKGIVSISGALLLGVFMTSAAFFMQEKQKRDYAANYAATVEEEATALKSAERLREYQPTKDSDNDGISDWKEKLQGTDPEIPNEPKETYENTEAIINKIREAATGSSATSSRPNTFTDRFARSYLETLVRTKYSGDSADLPEDALVDDALTSIDRTITHTTYTANDLVIIQKASTSEIRTYGNEVGKILSTNLVPAGVDPYAIITKAVQDDDREMLKRLNVFIHAFSHLRDELLSVPVPPALVKEHLGLVNTFSIINDDLVTVRDKGLDDPLLGFGHGMSLIEHLNAVSPAVSRIREELETKEIYYTNEEPGTKIFDF